MIRNNRVYGGPLVQYRDTKANIAALSGIEEGASAYATDTNECGSYDGATWAWTPVTTAANDIQVGDGSGNWIKKTLAEFIAILRAATGWREVLSAALTYYVRTDGNDSNTGLVNSAGGAFLTVQKAIDVASMLDSTIYNVTIQIVDGTYAGVMVAKPMAGAGIVIIQGNSGTPANVVISLSGSQTGLLSDGCKTPYYIKDLKITGNAASTTGIWAKMSSVYYSNIVFNGNLIDINIDNNSYVICLGNYSIIASAGRHWYLASGGRLTCNARTITLTGTPAWTTAFLDCGYAASAILYNNTYSGAATGKRVNIVMNGVVETYGTATLTTVFPGNVDGTKATGGEIG